MQEIAIFGAGVGGLSVAHKLAMSNTRYKITIYEMKNIAGGLARSEGPACDTREISWRVFFGFYQYLPYIMRQIPIRDGLSVYDHLVPYHNRTLPESRSLRDLLGIGVQIVSITTASNDRLDRWDNLSWNQSVGMQTQLDVAQWLGLDRYRASYLSVAKIGIEQFVLGSQHKDKVLDGPTNIVWFQPWVRFLQSLGVTFHFNSIVKSIVDDGGKGAQTTKVMLENGTQVIADTYVIALPVEALARVAPAMFPTSPTLSKSSQQIQLAFQLYLKDHLSFGNDRTTDNPILSVLLSQSPWGLIIEAKDISWSADCAPWSVTVCQADTPGIVTGKSLITSSREDAFKEVLAQILLDQGFIALLERENPHYSGIHVERWNTMDDTYFFSEYGMSTTEPKFSNNANTKVLRPSYRVAPNVYLSTAYTRQTIDIFSMEAAAMSANYVASDITHGLVPFPTHPKRPLPVLMAPVRAVDSMLFKMGGPHVLWVLVVLFVLFISIIYKPFK